MIVDNLGSKNFLSGNGLRYLCVKPNNMIINTFNYSNQPADIAYSCYGPFEIIIIDQNFKMLHRIEKLLQKFDCTAIASEMGNVVITGCLTESRTPYVHFDVDPPRENSNYDYHAARHFKDFLQRNEAKDLIQYVHCRPDQR